MTDFTSNLLQAQKLINELLNHIKQFNIDNLIYHAPIEDRIKINTSTLTEIEQNGSITADGIPRTSWNYGNGGVGVWRQDEIMGLKKFIDSVKHHSAQIDNIVNSGIIPQDDPLPSIIGLITYWKIVISARPPIVGLRIGMIPRSPTSTSATNGLGACSAQKSRSANKSKGGREKEVWVDVIAQGGREWIRIYSKKISHLLAEFREADSYINSDYDSDSDTSSSCSNNSTPHVDNGNRNGHKVEAGLDNSLIRTAKELLAAASTVDRIPGASIPILTMRLTRIPSTPQDRGGGGEEVECEWPDSRIEKSFEIVRQMGINLVFGDLSEIPLADGDEQRKAQAPTTGTSERKRTIPSLKFNLDITTLMGLCSDVLHYPLPKDKEEAKRRSLRPSTHLLNTKSAMMGRGRDGTGKGSRKQQRENDNNDGNGNGSDDEEELKGQSQNSRELYKCLREEMERPFIEEFNKVVLEAYRARRCQREGSASTTTTVNGNGNGDGDDLKDQLSSSHIEDDIPPGQIEFWTTHQAAQYTYEALTSGPAHGEGGEQRRMLIMLGLEKGDFFKGSRYQGNEGVFKDFKLRIFDCDQFVTGKLVSDTWTKEQRKQDGNEVMTSKQVVITDKDEDSEKGKTGFHHTLQSITSTFISEYYTGSKKNLPSFLQPKKIPSPPIAKISLPFPVVSLHSLERGSREGMTTIMMGTATLKEVWSQSRWRTRGWERGYYSHLELPLLPTHTHTQRKEIRDEDEKPKKEEIANTAIIIFPYRVFGEGKRVKFESGDWTYPCKLADADE